MSTTATYGSWASPISGAQLVEDVVTPSQVFVDGDTTYWNESRPAENGRQVVVAWRSGADPIDVLDAPFSARTTVHEYGGQSFAVSAGVVFFSNFDDQRLYRRALDGSVTPLTAPPPGPRSVRYADPTVTGDGRWLLCVRERHDVDGSSGALGVKNDLVAVATDGSGNEVVLAEGHDFYGAPRCSPDGARLTWLTWDHPDMPWDASQLWVADLDSDMGVGPAVPVAGGPGESISQPRFAPDGRLVYLSDRSDFWNLYDENARALAPRDAEFGGPDWLLGQSTYAHLPDGRIIAVVEEHGAQHLVIINDGACTEVVSPLTVFSSLRALDGNRIVCCAGSATVPLGVVVVDCGTGSSELVRSSRSGVVATGYVSVPRHMEYSTTGGLTAHALYYAPRNQDFQAKVGERPPLIVQSHGGPTASASQLFNPKIQYWTSRGFAVVDVDYGGSSGYGRAYRERLAGKLGVVDVDDCVEAASHLARRGRVDPRRMVIHGGSSGGYTALAALTFRSVFTAGASSYGISDLTALARDTHKFESHYLDKLIGPYPEAASIYSERSPIEHVDRLNRPVIFFQGLDDAIVPPSQTDTIVTALRNRGVPVAYLSFEGEQHGFRKAETIVRVAEAELYFYGQVMKFAPADDIAPVEIGDADLLIT